MAEDQEYIKEINEQRMKIWERGKELLEGARAEKRSLSAEEAANYDKLNDDITRLDKTRDAFLASAKAEREFHEVNEALRQVTTPVERADLAVRDDQMEADIRSFFRAGVRGTGGEIANRNITQRMVNALEIDMTVPARIYDHVRHGLPIPELRAVVATDTGASGGSLTVPTTVASEIYAFMTAQVAMRRIGCTIITTAGGNAMTFPKVSSHSIATQVANQDTAFAGTNPVLSTMTLNAYDYGELVPISNDMLEDSGVDVLGFVTRQIGRAIGQVTATAYVTGSGSSAPNGIQTAITGAGTIASGGSLFGLPAGNELEKLIDLQYSVVDSYRQNGAAWLMRDLTGATIRKIRDGAGGTAGQFVWQPSPTVGAIGGQPDTFLGDPVFFDPNVASMASNAKIVYYGDWSAYYIRDTRNFRLERSDDLLFDKNQVAFRGLLRTDGDLIDSAAINCLKQSV